MPLAHDVVLAATHHTNNLTTNQTAGGVGGLALLVLLVFGFYLWRWGEASIMAAVVFILIGVSGGLVVSLLMGGINLASNLAR